MTSDIKNNSEKFKFRGQSFASRLLFLISLLYLLPIFIALIFGNHPLFIRIIGILLFLYFSYFLRQLIIRFKFLDEGIRVHYLYGNIKEFSYDDIEVIYKNRAGFSPVYVYVARLKKAVKAKSKLKLRNPTFYCIDSTRPELDEFLATKGFNIKTKK